MGRVTALEHLYTRIRDARAAIAELSVPPLGAPAESDLAAACEAYKGWCDRRGYDPSLPWHRKMLLMAVLYLYCPASLAGAKITEGLRVTLAKCLGLRTPTILSRDLSAVRTYWRAYPGFRADASDLFAVVARAVAT